MKRKALAVFLLAFIVLNFSACGTSKSKADSADALSLKTIYENYFLVGNIINNLYMRGEYLELLVKHFNVVTAENQMKPDHLAPRTRGGNYNWSAADNMVNTALSHNMKVHGHTLVWHNQTHAWMTEGTPQQVRQNMIDHINTVLAHFKGRVYSWDVVNEAIRERVHPGEQNNDWRTQLRTESGWFRVLGADYIELAFRTARAADPDIILYYNDYNLDNSRKATVVANMVKEINDKYRAEGNTRLLIEGIGMQAHYGATTSIPNVRNSIERFIALGVKVDISELDVDLRGIGSGSFGTRKDTPVPQAEQRIQAIKYAELFNLFKEYSEHITRVTMWGMDDENSWKSLGNPCLWDGNLEPKQAFFGVANPNRTLGL